MESSSKKFLGLRILFYMTVAKGLATVAKTTGRMTHFIKYKDELIDLDRITLIRKIDEIAVFNSRFLIGFHIGSGQNINYFIFDTQEERDEYFLKIQERIEKIQGFKIDLGDKND